MLREDLSKVQVFFPICYFLVASKHIVYLSAEKKNGGRIHYSDSGNILSINPEIQHFFTVTLRGCKTARKTVILTMENRFTSSSTVQLQPKYNSFPQQYLFFMIC